jgi:hypothetical protein
MSYNPHLKDFVPNKVLNETVTTKGGEELTMIHESANFSMNLTEEDEKKKKDLKNGK